MAAKTSRVAGIPVLLLIAACSAPSARLQVGYIQPTLTGDLALAQAAGSLPAGQLSADIESGLGLDDDASSLYGRVELDAGPVRLTASGFRYDQSGSGTLNASFGAIAAGVPVDSDIRMGAYKAAATFDLLDVGPVRISPGVGVDLFDLQAEVSNQTVAQTETIDELLPVPMVFVQGEVDVGPVAVTLDVGGMDASYGEYSGTFFDVEALVLYAPVEHVEVFAGYRWIALDARGESEDRDFTADLDLGGWFVGGGLRF